MAENKLSFGRLAYRAEILRPQDPSAVDKDAIYFLVDSNTIVIHTGSGQEGVPKEYGTGIVELAPYLEPGSVATFEFLNRKFVYNGLPVQPCFVVKSQDVDGSGNTVIEGNLYIKYGYLGSPASDNASSLVINPSTWNENYNGGPGYSGGLWYAYFQGTVVVPPNQQIPISTARFVAQYTHSNGVIPRECLASFGDAPASTSFPGNITPEQINALIEVWDLAHKVTPIGAIMMWAGRVDRVPSNYLICDGRTLTRESYPELARVFGADSVASFRLPDLSGRFIVGIGQCSSGSHNSSGEVVAGNNYVINTASDGTNGTEAVRLEGNQAGVQYHDHEMGYGGQHYHAYIGDAHSPSQSVPYSWNGLNLIGYPKSNGSTMGGRSAAGSGVGIQMRTSDDLSNDYSPVKGHKHLIYGHQNEPARATHENRPPWYALAYIIRVK